MDDAPILICYDDTESSNHAVAAAATLFPGRRAVVLNVGSPITVSETYAILVTPVPGDGFETANEEDAMATARIGAEQARDAGFFDVEARAILEAPTWEGVVDVANEIEAAVIVLGTLARGSVRETFEGSVAHPVVEHAGRPVLIVPPRRPRK